ncbi:MAG: tRNA (guanine(10)-N(2))-dimethyltransferase [Candidatus Aenigmatarchaeota archaeon]
MKTVEEGEVEIEVDEGRPYDKEVFYNPRMEFDRNLSVAVASVVEPEKLCDALSASGVRGIRYGKEAEVPEVWVNDANPKSIELIHKNLERNELDCEVRNEDAAVLLREEDFDFVDIDPFGSPAEFLDAAAGSIRRRGFLGITATDTSSFFGTYPRVSRRRYGRKSMKTGYNKELGLRILVSALIESLGRYKKTFYPRLCYFREHYARIFGEVVKGAREVQENFQEFGHISHCFSCGWRKKDIVKKCPQCGERTEFVEVYLGKLNNEMFCKDVAKQARERSFYDEAELAEKLSEDVRIPFHHDLHYVAKKQKLEVRKTGGIIKELKEGGYEASESVYSTTGVKTDAPFKEVVEAMK